MREARGMASCGRCRTQNRHVPGGQILSQRQETRLKICLACRDWIDVEEKCRRLEERQTEGGEVTGAGQNLLLNQQEVPELSPVVPAAPDHNLTI